MDEKNQLLLIIGIATIIISCPLERKNIQVRAICERPLGSSLTFSVFVEGPYGTSLDACRVLIKTPSGAVSLIRYNSNRAALRGVFRVRKMESIKFRYLPLLHQKKLH
ncbi:hypothetical protein C5O22_06020 [Treponema sp. J25]|nr:hypothetical protein C5O22_06020 [Treponema sp. J25]